MRSRRLATAPPGCRKTRLGLRAWVGAGVIGLGVLCPVAGAQEARFTSEPSATNAEGHLTLQWDGGPDAVEYQLERDGAPGFESAEVWYEGPATQTFISGLEEGEHFYRVRARAGGAGGWGPWSAPVGFTVEHQPMGLAWGLFAVGAVLFVSIVGFVVWQATGGRAGGAAEGGPTDE